MLLATLPWSYAQLRLYDRLMFEEVAEVGGTVTRHVPLAWLLLSSSHGPWLHGNVAWMLFDWIPRLPRTTILCSVLRSIPC